MKYIAYFCLLATSLCSTLKASNHTLTNTSLNKPKKILVAYFSHSGNTKFVAEKICELTNSDLFEIETVHQYSDDYDTIVNEARTELRQQIRPELKTKLENADDYDVIFIGYPNWWGTYPMAIATFLEENSFSGKTIIPFCTHEGSRFGKSLQDLSKACPNSQFKKGISIRGRNVDSSSAIKDIQKWIQNLNL